MTAVTETATSPSSRKASRPVRRQQLIDATIAVLARKGYSALTVADVAKTAGLSVGIINFHFESKEKLLPPVSAIWPKNITATGMMPLPCQAPARPRGCS